MTDISKRSKHTAVYAFTPEGARLGARIAASLRGELHLPRRLYEQLTDSDRAAVAGCLTMDALAGTVARLFHARARHIFVGAAGIAVRAIAPHLRGKAEDPAVAVTDQEGRFCISLLSGHLGGANELARELAAITGGSAVVTTATDTAGLPALDELAARLGLRIADVGAAKSVSAALLRKQTPQLYDPEMILCSLPDFAAELFSRVSAPGEWDAARPGAWTHFTAAPPGALGLHPPCLFAGVGCRRGAQADEIETLLRSTLGRAGLAPESLAGMASIEAKADEPGLLLAAERLGQPITFFPPDQLASVPTPSSSAMVRKHMGVDCVCEAAALLAGRNGRLIVKKTKSARVTVALAASWWSASDRATRTT